DAAVENDEGYLRLLLLMSSNREHGATSTEQGEKGREENVERPTPNAQRPISEQRITNNEELITLADLAASLVARNPRSLPHRTFLALARLKQNRAADALAVYENVTVARGALTPSALAVHAAVLAANGRAE